MHVSAGDITRLQLDFAIARSAIERAEQLLDALLDGEQRARDAHPSARAVLAASEVECIDFERRRLLRST
jgi:hypothetical protein